MDSVLDKVRSLVATLFNVPVEDITEDSSPETVEAWDSMGQLNLILELEQEFDIAMTHDRVQRMTSVGAIAELLTEAGVG